MYKYMLAWTAKRKDNGVTLLGNQDVSSPIPFSKMEDVHECAIELKVRIEEYFHTEVEDVYVLAFSKYEEVQNED